MVQESPGDKFGGLQIVTANSAGAWQSQEAAEIESLPVRETLNFRKAHTQSSEAV